MIAAVPGLNDLANIKGEQISNVGSQDMSFDIMLKLAKRINELAPSSDVDGIVITHGTDTMEETAFFLNLTAKTDKPVVMVGSMRPSTAVSADGPLNLYNAVGVAADPKAAGRGVLVVMNDWIHGAHSLTKTSTTAVQTFMSPLRGLVGVTSYGKNDFFSSPSWKHTTQTEFDISGVTQLPRVDIIFASADMSPDLIDCAVTNGAKGIVIAGVGNGNMNKASVDRGGSCREEGRGGRAQFAGADGYGRPQRRARRRQTRLHRVGRTEPAEGTDPPVAGAAEASAEPEGTAGAVRHLLDRSCRLERERPC